ncbi:hypothetical protein EUGRSUZ_A01784 [Eucalyptus grandis]|uniref:Uncharacterized protein n=2 Tax=Eucalyptus grandis TaxID=71139 RepID=A0ACC3M4F0_EUCGR|nr:hypothetical protein EUGRSUZ_A01784 [Eucalyptus grandis]
MVHKMWKIIPRPLMETVLNNHAQHHRVLQPLILHGPRGIGKTTLILERLLGEWNKGVHVTGYVDLAQSIKDHHPQHNNSFPWYSWSNCDPPNLVTLQNQLEQCLESMAEKGVKLVSEKVTGSALWSWVAFALSTQCNAKEIDGILGLKEKGRSLSLAKEVIKLQHGWRSKEIAHLNWTGGFSRSLAQSCTDWPCLLLELLSQAAELDHFQPKLVINDIDVLRHAILTDDSSVSASMYHDSLIWRIIALGANERCLPVILVTSDSYYSYRAFMDFGFPDIFISRETFGWTPQEAKMHMVANFFNNSEWLVISEVLGSNPCHLFELYTLIQSHFYSRVISEKNRTFEDIVDAYLAYLQVTTVNPGMDKAVKILQKFAADTPNGAPWRHPPSDDNPTLNLEWAKLQLLDFVQSLINAEFGVNYFADCSLEIFDDPSAVALIEVGLLYTQRDPSFIRPVSRGIQRCLVRWLVQERMQLSFQSSLKYLWQRVFRGRSYRHLMLQEGYK